MADLSITAASVVAGQGAVIENGIAGAAITAGQWVYLDSTTTGRYQLADNNSATAAARVARGVALNGAANGQPLAIAKGGPVTIGATLTPGVAYYLSATAGGICPVADLTTGSYPCLLGMAVSASVLNTDIQAAGVAL
jgi:hypothetical protein